MQQQSGRIRRDTKPHSFISACCSLKAGGQIAFCVRCFAGAFTEQCPVCPTYSQRGPTKGVLLQEPPPMPGPGRERMGFATWDPTPPPSAKQFLVKGQSHCVLIWFCSSIIITFSEKPCLEEMVKCLFWGGVESPSQCWQWEFCFFTSGGGGLHTTHFFSTYSNTSKRTIYIAFNLWHWVLCSQGIYAAISQQNGFF